MKTLLSSFALFALLTQAASAAAPAASPEHACDKLAIDSISSLFSITRVTVTGAKTIASNHNGAMGENVDIRIDLAGDVKGYVVANTAHEGDSDDCNLTAVSVQLN